MSSLQLSFLTALKFWNPGISGIIFKSQQQDFLKQNPVKNSDSDDFQQHTFYVEAFAIPNLLLMCVFRDMVGRPMILFDSQIVEWFELYLKKSCAISSIPLCILV